MTKQQEGAAEATFTIYLCERLRLLRQTYTFSQFSNIYQNYLILCSKSLVLRQDPNSDNFCHVR